MSAAGGGGARCCGCHDWIAQAGLSRPVAVFEREGKGEAWVVAKG